MTENKLDGEKNMHQLQISTETHTVENDCCLSEAHHHGIILDVIEPSPRGFGSLDNSDKEKLRRNVPGKRQGKRQTIDLRETGNDIFSDYRKI
mmetsp:Transcript_7316/g.11131  ORF Transcript_7316/g.11131 Transcript_7316/m.11131 type:complete len:93 (+) Transcript_7316:133-411(+)